MDKNVFAPTPPMGWNSYDYYNTTVNEVQIKANADYMSAHLKDFGWEYIVVDIQWYAHNVSKDSLYQYIPFSSLEIDTYSRLLPDPARFPSSKGGAGFAPLARYIHDLGLKFGIHIMRGIPRIAAHHHMAIKGSTLTADMAADPSSICGWNPDMYGLRNIEAGQAYYDSLLELYASWGVDFIKCDDICNTNIYKQNPYSARHEIEMLFKAIQKCGRPIVLSLSPGPALIDKAWHYETHANMWRITDDFWDNWTLLKDMFRRCELWQKHVAPGCYPDCDMLPLGYVGKGFNHERITLLTKEEQKTMMTLWCLFGSPLIIGAELPKLDEWTLSLLTNQSILNMLPPKYQPHQIRLDESEAVWTSVNDGVVSYLALFNLSDSEQVVSVSMNEIGVLEQNVTLLDLWTDEVLRPLNGLLSQTLPAHGCQVYTVSV